MMNFKKVLILLFVFSCISCSVSKIFIINGKRMHELSGECGTIKIHGSLFNNSIFIAFDFDNEYFVDIDSLKIETYRSDMEICNLRFLSKNKKLTNTKLKFKEGESLSVTFNLTNKRRNDMISLLPSGFIKCNGKPIITDTIDIHFR